VADIACDNADMLLPASQYVGASAFTWPAALFLWGPGSRTDLHRHHCVQLVMALDGTLRFRQGQRQRWTTCSAVLVRPDARHEVDARGTDVLIAFVDAESELGAALATRTPSLVSPIPPATVGEWRTQLGEAGSLTAARVEPWVTGTLLCDRRPPSIDHRVQRVLRNLPNRLAEADAVSLEAVAASVGLSPSRFLHLFTASVGVPLRPYVLWLRLQCGARELARGRSVADAAYAAGFSDAAHFTRTFRRMIGATPRQIQKRGFAARDFHLDRRGVSGQPSLEAPMAHRPLPIRKVEIAGVPRQVHHRPPSKARPL
jgi:AraC-like DNA-binding protein